MDEITLEEILSCNLGELTEVLVNHLKEITATRDDTAEVKFGNADFEGRLTIKLKIIDDEYIEELKQNWKNERYSTLESGIDYGVKDTINNRNIFDTDITDELNRLYNETEQLKRQIQQDIDDIKLCQSFITDKGYSMRDLKEWADLKKELKEGGKMTDKQLLEDIRHELVSINGLYATDRKDKTIETLFQLNYDELIEKIDKELQE